MSSSPLVSVVLPVFNGERYLDTAIRSLLNQTHARLELIVVNDGSTDGSAAIVQRLAAEDKRVSLISQANAGVSAARNRGTERANGEFIAVMDADDVCHPRRIAKQIHFMQRHELAVCGSFMRTFGRDVRTKRYPRGDAELRAAIACFSGHVFGHPSVMLRAEVAKRFLYDESLRYAEDYDLWLRLLGDVTLKMGNVQEPLIRYRLHPNQSTQQHLDADAELVKPVWQRAMAGLGLNINEADTDLHFRVWRRREALSEEALRQYGALLEKLAEGLSEVGVPRPLMAQRWARVCVSQRKLYKRLVDVFYACPLAQDVPSWTRLRIHWSRFL